MSAEKLEKFTVDLNNWHDEIIASIQEEIDRIGDRTFEVGELDIYFVFEEMAVVGTVDVVGITSIQGGILFGDFDGDEDEKVPLSDLQPFALLNLYDQLFRI